MSTGEIKVLKGRIAIVTGSTSGIGDAAQIDDRAQREGITVAQAKAEQLGEKQPSGEFATPEQMGALCVFLCSDSAAQMRGAALPVDGAWLAQ